MRTILVDRHPAAIDASDEAIDAVTRFLLMTQRSMPDYLRAPLAALTLAFAVSAVAVSGRPFDRMPEERKIGHVRSWSTSRLGPRRDLIKFYETLALFGWYAELYGEDYQVSHGG